MAGWKMKEKEIHAISAPFLNRIWHKNLNKMPLLGRLKVPGSSNLKQLKSELEERKGDCAQSPKQLSIVGHSAGLVRQET